MKYIIAMWVATIGFVVWMNWERGWEVDVVDVVGSLVVVASNVLATVAYYDSRNFGNAWQRKESLRDGSDGAKLATGPQDRYEH